LAADTLCFRLADALGLIRSGRGACAPGGDCNPSKSGLLAAIKRNFTTATTCLHHPGPATTVSIIGQSQSHLLKSHRDGTSEQKEEEEEEKTMKNNNASKGPNLLISRVVGSVATMTEYAQFFFDKTSSWLSFRAL
jgi:hypothetical protein